MTTQKKQRVTIADHYDPSGIITAASDPEQEFSIWVSWCRVDPNDIEWVGDEFTLEDFTDYIDNIDNIDA
jgi:hypothetical protein